MDHYHVPGSAVAIVGAPNLRQFVNNNGTNSSKGFHCMPDGEFQSIAILSLGAIGVTANVVLMLLILINKRLRRWSQGLLFHQAVVDCGRAAILLPMGFSILYCEPIRRCSLVETAFLLLVTVSTVNMLTTVLNDSPVFPEDGSEEDIISGPLLMDSPQCVMFGTFMIWFASITINLGPTFLSGGLAARSEMIRYIPSCPLVHGPFRHYILNMLWIMINVICVLLTLFHLRKLHRDLTKANVEAVKVAGLVTTLVNVTGSGNPKTPTPVNGSVCLQPNVPPQSGKIGTALEEHRRMRNYLIRMEKEGVQKVKMFLIITVAYIIFWGPLYFVTLFKHAVIADVVRYEITLYIAYMHAFINPILFMILHRGIRNAIFGIFCCCFWNTRRAPIYVNQSSNVAVPNDHNCIMNRDYSIEISQANLLVPPPPPPVHQSPILAQLNQEATSSNPFCFQHQVRTRNTKI